MVPFVFPPKTNTKLIPREAARRQEPLEVVAECLATLGRCLVLALDSAGVVWGALLGGFQKGHQCWGAERETNSLAGPFFRGPLS